MSEGSSGSLKGGFGVPFGLKADLELIGWYGLYMRFKNVGMGLALAVEVQTNPETGAIYHILL